MKTTEQMRKVIASLTREEIRVLFRVTKLLAEEEATAPAADAASDPTHFHAVKPSEVPCSHCGGPIHEFVVPSDVWNTVVRMGRERAGECLCCSCYHEFVTEFVRRQEVPRGNASQHRIQQQDHQQGQVLGWTRADERTAPDREVRAPQQGNEAQAGPATAGEAIRLGGGADAGGVPRVPVDAASSGTKCDHPSCDQRTHTKVAMG